MISKQLFDKLVMFHESEAVVVPLNERDYKKLLGATICEIIVLRKWSGSYVLVARSV